MAQKNANLFEPIKIGNIEIKNRVAMAPMGISG
jgi:2-enoate reductase